MKIFVRGVAVMVLAASLCGFAGSSIDEDVVGSSYFDRHGFAYDISDQDRQTVEYMLERHPEWKTGGAAYTNAEDEVVFNSKYIR